MQKVATAPNVFNREHSLINGIKVSECLIVVCRFDQALVLECNRIKGDIAPFTDFMLAFVPRNLIHGRETEGKPSGLARDDGHLHCRGQFAGAGRARGVRFFSLARFGANAPSWGGVGWGGLLPGKLIDCQGCGPRQQEGWSRQQWVDDGGEGQTLCPFFQEEYSLRLPMLCLGVGQDGLLPGKLTQKV